jgi:protein-tyrosine-phosphatase
MNILFVCASNRVRSTVAEIFLRNIWGDWEGHRVKSAGTNAGPYGFGLPDKVKDYLKSIDSKYTVPETASKPVTRELLDWADRIVYFQAKHEKMLQMLFEDYPFKDKLICIGQYHNPKLDGIPGVPLKNDTKFKHVMQQLYYLAMRISTMDYVKRTPRPKVARFPRHKDTGSGVIINVRGINGSGKSKIMFDLIERFKAKPMKDEGGYIWAYDLNTKPKAFILGNYETLTGGCDVIPTLAQVSEQVMTLAKMGSVLFEGIIISGTATRWLYLANALDNHKVIFGFLDTPKEECYARRVVRDGKCNVQNLEQKYRYFQRSFRVLAACQGPRIPNFSVRLIPHLRATKTVLEWLKEGNLKQG